MRKETFKFKCRREQITKLLARGPMSYDQLYRALGFDPDKHIKAMTADGSLMVKKEPFGNNGNFFRNIYFVPEQPEPLVGDINGWSDELRVLMGLPPVKDYYIEGRSMIYDEEEYYAKHGDEIRNQAPTIGVRRFGSIQAYNGDLEMYGVGL